MVSFNKYSPNNEKEYEKFYIKYEGKEIEIVKGCDNCVRLRMCLYSIPEKYDLCVWYPHKLNCEFSYLENETCSYFFECGLCRVKE